MRAQRRSKRAAAWLLWVVVLGVPGCGAPAAPSAASASDPGLAGLSQASLAPRLEARGPALLECFRKRAAFQGASYSYQTDPAALTITATLRYSLFLKPRERSALLRFSLSPSGTISGCTLQDPLPSASPTPCPWLEEKIARVLAPP